MERFRRENGRRFDHEEKIRKKEARKVHKHSKQAQQV